jgi:hypothetical protein
VISTLQFEKRITRLTINRDHHGCAGDDPPQRHHAVGGLAPLGAATTDEAEDPADDPEDPEDPVKPVRERGKAGHDADDPEDERGTASAP